MLQISLSLVTCIPNLKWIIHIGKVTEWKLSCLQTNRRTRRNLLTSTGFCIFLKLYIGNFITNQSIYKCMQHIIMKGPCVSCYKIMNKWCLGLSINPCRYRDLMEYIRTRENYSHRIYDSYLHWHMPVIIHFQCAHALLVFVQAHEMDSPICWFRLTLFIFSKPLT